MLNHNGGPRHLTDKEFRTLVKTIVLSRLSGHQKLLSISVAAVADEDGQAVLGAEDMKRVCSVQKRDTVFAAKRDIAEDGLGIIATVSQAGRPNKYHVMPPRVVASIIEAYHARLAAGEEPIPQKETSPVPKNGTGDVHEKGATPIPKNGTSPVPQNVTSPEKGDWSRARIHARIESPSGILSPIENNNISPPTPPTAPSEQHAGHGVWVNCDTIRHKDFRISLPSLELAIAGRLPKDEIRAKATAHALQWAAEIEGGKKPADVVPSKIANFLSATLMGEINRAAAADAKLAKAKQGSKPFMPSRWALT